nr:putative beta-D-xylosidase 2 [Ipomoea batatas]
MRWTSTLLPHLCLWSLSTNGWITSSLSTNGRQHQQQGNSGNWTVKQGTAAELGGEATAPGLAESCFRRAPPPSAWTWQRRELACEVVRKSLVLLKNGKDSEKPFLPLDRNAKKILVAGTHSDDLGYQRDFTFSDAARTSDGVTQHQLFSSIPCSRGCEGNRSGEFWSSSRLGVAARRSSSLICEMQ